MSETGMGKTQHRYSLWFHCTLCLSFKPYHSVTTKMALPLQSLWAGTIKKHQSESWFGWNQIRLVIYQPLLKQNIGAPLTHSIVFVRPLRNQFGGHSQFFFLQQFCNCIQLNRILPPGPRGYWNELVDQHKAISDDKKWMYDADPFEAKNNLQKSMTPTRSFAEPSRSSERQFGHSPKSDYPEVLMATSLRDLVEDAIKQVCSLQTISITVFTLKTGTGTLSGRYRIYTCCSCPRQHDSA